MQAIVESKPGSWNVGGPAAGQPEYLPLEVTRGDEGELWSQWRPNPTELYALHHGAPIRIGLLCQRQPPIIVEIGPIPKPPPIPEAELTRLQKIWRGLRRLFMWLPSGPDGTTVPFWILGPRKGG